MARQRHAAEQIIGKLREVEVGLASGRKVGELCRSIGASEQNYYRWRAEYGVLKLETSNNCAVEKRQTECSAVAVMADCGDWI
jgi:putative transposase